MKYLIINADDFGMSKRFNKGILELAGEGLLSSTTVMVNDIQDDQEEQVAELKRYNTEKKIDIGLHVVLELDDDIRKQISLQYKRFIEIFGQEPDHIDVHKPSRRPETIEYIEKVDDEVAKYCSENSIPCRNSGSSPYTLKTTDTERYIGTYRTFQEIEAWLKDLEDNSTNEILFHPGYYDPESTTSWNEIREEDIEHIKKMNLILNNYNIKRINFSML